MTEPTVAQPDQYPLALAKASARPHGPLLQDMRDGKDFVDEMVKAADALQDYTFHFEMTAYKKGGEVTEEGNFYFKKPRLLRLEEVGRYKRGSVAVLQNDGKVRAHLGGALKFIVVTLNPYAGELQSVNNYPMVDSDFLSLAQFLQNWVKQGIQSRVSATPMLLNGSTRKVYMVDMYKASSPDTVLKRVFVDEDTKLPVEWYDFVNGQLWSRSVFKDIKTNAGLTDETFTMKGQSKWN